MTDRGLKIALGLSVALNIFVVGAVAGGLMAGGRALDDRPHRDRPPVIDLVRSLDEEERAAAEAALREGGLAAREHFQLARRQRAEAIDLAGAETFDRAAVESALEQSRSAEAAGRARLESTLLDVMASLSQEERQRLAPGLARRGRERGGRRGRPDDVMPPPPGSGPGGPAE